MYILAQVKKEEFNFVTWSILGTNMHPCCWWR